MSAYLENMNISRGHALASTALVLSVLAILFAVSMRATPCVSAASGSCSVGETETFAGDLGLGKDADIEYEGATENDFETTLTVTDPTADRTITFPDASGTVALTGGGAATVPEGGTGVTTLAANGVLVGDGANAVNVTAAGNAGEVLTSNGAGSDPTFQAAGGGLSSIHQWALDPGDTSGLDPFTSWSQSFKTGGVTAIGGTMSESSGVFTFPSTGIWLINWNLSVETFSTSNDNKWGCFINTTHNNSTWVQAAYTSAGIHGSTAGSNCSTQWIFDVDDVSNYKVSFGSDQASSNYARGVASDVAKSTAYFIRLADSP